MTAREGEVTQKHTILYLVRKQLGEACRLREGGGHSGFMARNRQLVRSRIFWLKMSTRFLCCFEAIMAYSVSPLAAVPTIPMFGHVTWLQVTRI